MASAFDWGRFQLDAFAIESLILAACSQDYVVAGYVEDGYVCTEPTKVGGDDAFHKGWNKKAWKKKQVQEAALEATIQATYNRIMGIEPDAEEVKEIAAEVAEKAPVEAIKPATVDYSGVVEWLATQEKIVAQILAQRQEEDDEEALLMLL